MIKIAVVEDEKRWSDAFLDYIRRYSAERKMTVSADVFPDGMEFISSYEGGYDLVLMDIAMPHMNGLEAAQRLRATDEYVCLIFITTMAQYAVKGYEVNAFDFLVKPVEYELFKIKMDKVLARIESGGNKSYTVVTASGMRKLPLSDIRYVESAKHYLYFHTTDKEYKMRAVLNDIREFFLSNGFAEVNRSILVNLAFIEGYSAAEVNLFGGETLPLSRIYKTEFLKNLASHLGRGL